MTYGEVKTTYMPAAVTPPITSSLPSPLPSASPASTVSPVLKVSVRRHLKCDEAEINLLVRCGHALNFGGFRHALLMTSFIGNDDVLLALACDLLNLGWDWAGRCQSLSTGTLLVSHGCLSPQEYVGDDEERLSHTEPGLRPSYAVLAPPNEAN